MNNSINVPISVIMYAYEMGLPVEVLDVNNRWIEYKKGLPYGVKAENFRITHKNGDGLSFGELLFRAEMDKSNIKINGRLWGRDEQRTETITTFDIMILINCINAGKEITVKPRKVKRLLTFDELLNVAKRGAIFHYKNHSTDYVVYNPSIIYHIDGTIYINSVPLEKFNEYSLDGEKYPILTDAPLPPINQPATSEERTGKIMN